MFVETKYIFYGPIELVETGPFVLKNSDLKVVHKRYKQNVINFRFLTLSNSLLTSSIESP